MSATARIASSTHTHAGVSLLELEVDVVVVAGRMICRVVVCSTVSVLNTVVGSAGVVSAVVVPAAWTLPTDEVARRIPDDEADDEPCELQLLPHTGKNTLVWTTKAEDLYRFAEQRPALGSVS